MKHVWNKRRLAVLGAVAAMVGVTLWAVLPALATDYPPQPPASVAGVTPDDYPIGGQSGICGTLFPGFSGVEYDNNNPKTTNHDLNLGNGVSLKIVIDPTNTNGPLSDNTWPAYDKDKYLTLDTKGTAAIVGVGVNGGADTARYNYASGTVAGFVTHDEYLHAPDQSLNAAGDEPTQLYSISHLTVCYVPLSFIQGTVYMDADQSGTFNTGDSRPNDWTVRLYKDVTPGTPGGGTLVGTATTAASGSYSYHFDLLADGTHYRVCEVPSGTPPTGTDGVWVETEPLPSSATLCTGAGELAKGYDFTPSSATSKSDADFGNVGGYPCDSPGAGVATDDYTVGTCKDGQTYVFNTGRLGNGTPFVDYWVGDPSQDPIPLVEKLTFPDPIVSGQPQYSRLFYADGGGFPVDLSNLLQMPYCNRDPRDIGVSGYPDSFTLSGSYDEHSPSESGQVLPGSNTSCAISIKTYVDASGDGHLQAYVYALGDSIRSAG